MSKERKLRSVHEKAPRTFGAPLAMLVVDSARACWELISKLSAVGIGKEA